MMRFLFGLILAAALAIGCSDTEPPPANRSLVVIVETALYDSLEESLERYAETMRLEQFEIFVEPWGPGTERELRERIFDYFDAYRIDGALLVGHLPAAWYEQEGYDGYESFPTDIYFQDRDATWVDQDGNERFDLYIGDLHLEIYTARLQGTSTRLQEYFDRVHRYRDEGPLLDESAFIFIDDDWSDRTNTDDGLGLNELYDDIEVIKDKTESTLDNYLARLEGDGAEFVYQKIHAFEKILNFEHIDQDGNPADQTLRSSQVITNNLKASFINMTNCYASRFTVEGSLAEAYTVGTDYGLAIIGLTKEGVIVDPSLFHRNLSAGMSWGQAYRAWFNDGGRRSELNSLGVVIMGDPLLTLTGGLLAPGTAQESVTLPFEGFDHISRGREFDCGLAAEEIDPGSFEDYREDNPEFFED